MHPPIRGYWQDTKHEIACRNLYQIFSTEALTSRSFALGAVITVELERARKPTFETLCWVLCRTPPPMTKSGGVPKSALHACYAQAGTVVIWRRRFN